MTSISPDAATLTETRTQDTANKTSNPKSGVHHVYNVLSFDGGGIRGISSMVILQRLMDRVRAIENEAGMRKGHPADPSERKPVDYFDLGTGTSTGGLIALMLFRLEMNCTDVIASYNDLAKLVFQPKFGFISLHKLGRFGVWLGNSWLNIKALTGLEQYSHKPLEQAIDTVVGKFPLDADDAANKGEAYLMKKSKGQMFMCATLADRGESILLRNYAPSFAPLPISTGAADLDFSKITIKEAARATSAAPTYLKQATIQGLNFWDGGLLNNNPIYQAWDNRYDLIGADDHSPHIKCIVSLGTTHPDFKEAKKKNFIAKFFNTLSKTVAFATNTEAKHRDFERNMQQYNRRRAARGKPSRQTMYYRFNASTGSQSVSLADYLSMPTLVTYTETYLEKAEVVNWIDECAKRLAKI